jgi:hypothetical protein
LLIFHRYDMTIKVISILNFSSRTNAHRQDGSVMTSAS